MLFLSEVKYFFVMILTLLLIYNQFVSNQSIQTKTKIGHIYLPYETRLGKMRYIVRYILSKKL